MRENLSSMEGRTDWKRLNAIDAAVFYSHGNPVFVRN